MTTTQEQLAKSLGFAEDQMEVIIEDKFLRRTLIEVSMSMEKLFAENKVQLGQNYPSKSPWGLEIITSMERPREDKPIIFKYQYRVNRAELQQWVTEHKYLLEGPTALGFECKGLTVFIPGPGAENYHKANFVVTAKMIDGGAGDEDLRLDLLNETIEFTVHREVVSEHDWIVKTYNK